MSDKMFISENPQSVIIDSVHYGIFDENLTNKSDGFVVEFDDGRIVYSSNMIRLGTSEFTDNAKFLTVAESKLKCPSDKFIVFRSTPELNVGGTTL